MRNHRILLGSLALACLVATGTASGAAETVTCKDGTMAKAGRGACSHHGGVAKGAEAATAPPSAVPRQAAAPSETVTCKDGTTAKAGRGACSHHGGIAKSGVSGSPTGTAPPTTLPRRATTPAPTPMPDAPAQTRSGTPQIATGVRDPTGATAQCKDGSYSHAKHHTGACSHHGGVAKWIDGQ